MSEDDPGQFKIICHQLGCEHRATRARAREARTAALEHSQKESLTHPGHYVQVRTDNTDDEHPVVGFYFAGEKTQTEDESEQTSPNDTRYTLDGHRLADVQTIVISPDSIHFALRNEHKLPAERTHAFRVDPPFPETLNAELDIIDPRHSNLKYRKSNHPVPFYIPLQAFLAGSGDGWILADKWKYPNKAVERRKFHEQHGLASGTDLTDDQQNKWEQNWRNHVKNWKNTVNDALKNEIDVAAAIDGHPNTPITVEYESEWEWTTID